MAKTFETIARNRRALIAMIVLLAHVLLLIVFQRVLPKRLDDSPDGALTLVDVPVVPDPEPKQNEPQRPPDTPRENVAPSEAIAPDIELPEPTPNTPRMIDWRANAARSAEVVVAGRAQEKYRSFGPRKEPEKEEPAAPSIFRNDEPKHKLGEVGEDPSGDPVVWLNEGCYATLDKRVQTARDWIKENPGRFAGPEVTCLLWKFGSREPDGTLVQHIKPYEEPSLPKAGTEMNPLPAKIEAGGVFER